MNTSELRSYGRAIIRHFEGELTDSECDEILLGRTLLDLLDEVDRPGQEVLWGVFSNCDLEFQF